MLFRSDLALLASQWLNDETPEGMVWVSIDDPGVQGHEPFIGEMSKYETTNAQYCKFLNDALASGDILFDGYRVIGKYGSNSGVDYINQPYYFIGGPAQITFINGTFKVLSREGNDMSNHPVSVVTWFGAMAFANYYGWRLPTEWEWQAVADYDGSYNYGCGATISHTMANYDNINPLFLSFYPYTAPVGIYPAYGYGICDMAGNVYELTSSCQFENCNPDSDPRVYRGGSWGSPNAECDNRIRKMCIKIDTHIKDLNTSTYKQAIFEYFWLFGLWIVEKLYNIQTDWQETINLAYRKALAWLGHSNSEMLD